MHISFEIRGKGVLTMPSHTLRNGLYLIRQKCQVKGVLVDHYGILDIGNRLRLPVTNSLPVVIHQTPPRIRTDWLDNTGQWDLLGQITGEQLAIARINKALENDAYDLFGNNCEHFARFVALGSRESTQLQALGFFVGLFAVIILLAMSGEGA